VLGLLAPQVLTSFPLLQVPSPAPVTSPPTPGPTQAQEFDVGLDINTGDGEGLSQEDFLAAAEQTLGTNLHSDGDSTVDSAGTGEEASLRRRLRGLATSELRPQP
jgi:hypothetical protein